MISFMTQEKKKVPLLIISDAPTSGSGFGRITRDLATHIDTYMKDACRVATLGYGGPGSRKLNFQQYAIEGMRFGDWMIPNLPEVCKDWFGNEEGIIWFIWDASRTGWFSRPEVMCENPVLRKFLVGMKHKKWIYAPVDATGPNDKLSYPLAEALKGFDRVIAYTEWGGGVIDRTLGLQEGTTEHLPHGLYGAVFQERDREYSRSHLPDISKSFTITGNPVAPIADDEILISAVATNQPRKDWNLFAQTVAIASSYRKVRAWIKTDALEKAWSIPAILVDYGLSDIASITVDDLSDLEMTMAYSASDVTLGIGLGEGFGFPLLESVFCGTPAIHCNYGGGAEVLSSFGEEMLVDPIAYRYEGVYSCKRPVMDAAMFANRAMAMVGKRLNRLGEYNWHHLWRMWEYWLRKGF